MTARLKKLLAPDMPVSSIKLKGEDFEWVKSLFADDQLVLPPFPVYRWKGPGPRRYFVYLKSGEIVWFNSSSTIEAKTSGATPRALTEWYMKYPTYDDAIADLEIKADYGSLAHREWTVFQRDRKWNIDAAPKIVEAYCKEKNLDVDEADWTQKLWHDVLAMAQFVVDVKYKPIMVEAVLVSFEYGMATVIDSIGEMNYRTKRADGVISKGLRKGEQRFKTIETRDVAIIDWKSGRKGYRHEVQLAIQNRIVRENQLEYNGKPLVPRWLFNWNPKDWRKRPDYKLTDDQMGVIPEREVRLFSELADFRVARHPSLVTRASGIVTFGEEIGKNVIETISAQESIEREAEAAIKKDEAARKKKRKTGRKK